MTEKTKSPDNVERLLKHLKEGSLARRLVEGHRGPEADGRKERIKAVLRDRLEETKKSLGNAES